MTTSRRKWLQAFAAMAAGVPLSAAMIGELMASPVSEIEATRKPNGGRPRARLNANENPYGPSEVARQAVRDILSEGNRYVFNILGDIRRTLATYENVDPDCILMGAGSSETLIKAGIAFAMGGGRMVSAVPTFSILMEYAEVFGITWDKVDVNDRLEYDFAGMLSAIKSDTRLVFVCNPNNPTGTVMPQDQVQSFCVEAAKRTVVFVDEAYLDFVDPELSSSMVRLVKEGNRNIIVSRTFSKIYGLAGLRFGYAVAHPDLVKKMSTYHVGFPLSQPAIAAASACLNDRAFTSSVRQKTAAVRDYLAGYLTRKNLFFGESVTNFMLFKLPIDGGRLLDHMEEKGVLVRVWEFKGGPWCRVSLGTMDEVKLFTSELDTVLS